MKLLGKIKESAEMEEVIKKTQSKPYQLEFDCEKKIPKLFSRTSSKTFFFVGDQEDATQKERLLHWVELWKKNLRMDCASPRENRKSLDNLKKGQGSPD